MTATEKITGYLKETYKPDAVILYGSFADGSAAADSDFDALVIADGIKKHDASVIGNTVLDVFVYPPETFLSDYDPEEFVQVYDGRIILDASGLAAQLNSACTTISETNRPKRRKNSGRRSDGAKRWRAARSGRIPKGITAGIGC